MLGWGRLDRRRQVSISLRAKTAVGPRIIFEAAPELELHRKQT